MALLTVAAITIDKPTANGRVYPRDVVTKALEEAQGRIANRTLLLRDGRENDALKGVLGVITSHKVGGERIEMDVEFAPDRDPVIQNGIMNGTIPVSVLFHGKLGGVDHNILIDAKLIEYRI